MNIRDLCAEAMGYDKEAQLRLEGAIYALKALQDIQQAHGLTPATTEGKC